MGYRKKHCKLQQAGGGGKKNILSKIDPVKKIGTHPVPLQDETPQNPNKALSSLSQPVVLRTGGD